VSASDVDRDLFLDDLADLRDLFEWAEMLDQADEVTRGHCWAEGRATSWSAANRDMRVTNGPPRRRAPCWDAVDPHRWRSSEGS
jgi:hypothetical protein